MPYYCILVAGMITRTDATTAFFPTKYLLSLGIYYFCDDRLLIFKWV